MDPGRQAMESGQRAAEAGRRAMDAGRHATEESMRAGRDAALRTMDWTRDRRDRRGSEPHSEHGLLASILLFPFRLIAAVLRLGLLIVVVGIFVVVAYVFINGGFPSF